MFSNNVGLRNYRPDYAWVMMKMIQGWYEYSRKYDREIAPTIVLQFTFSVFKIIMSPPRAQFIISAQTSSVL